MTVIKRVFVCKRIRAAIETTSFSNRHQLTSYYHYLYYKNGFWSSLWKFLIYYQWVGEPAITLSNHRSLTDAWHARLGHGRDRWSL